MVDFHPVDGKFGDMKTQCENPATIFVSGFVGVETSVLQFKERGMACLYRDT